MIMHCLQLSVNDNTLKSLVKEVGAASHSGEGKGVRRGRVFNFIMRVVNTFGCGEKQTHIALQLSRCFKGSGTQGIVIFF